jgi:cytochrome c-type biogenesis protein CcmH/NrfG
MAESTTPGAVPASPAGGPATPPRVAPWLLLYTLGRVVVAAVLVAIVWLVGLGGLPALLWGVLLSVPVSYFSLRPVRDRLTEALAARSVARKAAKADIRARLAGTEDA